MSSSILSNTASFLMKEIAVTNKNFLNADNENVSMRSNVSKLVPYDGGSFVRIERESRMVDAGLIKQFNNSSSACSASEVISRFLGDFGNLLGAIGDENANDKNLTVLLSNIGVRIQDVISNPQNEGIRMAFWNSVDNLTSKFNSIEKFLDEAIEDINSKIEKKVEEFNSLVKEIANLNKSYLKSWNDSYGGTDYGDMIDTAATKISELLKCNFKTVNDGAPASLGISNQDLIFGDSTLTLAYEENKLIIKESNEDISRYINPLSGEIASLINIKNNIINELKEQYDIASNYVMKSFNNVFERYNSVGYQNIEGKKTYNGIFDSFGVDKISGNNLVISVVSDDNKHIVDSISIPASEFKSGMTVSDFIDTINKFSIYGNDGKGVFVDKDHKTLLGKIAEFKEDIIEKNGTLNLSTDKGKIVISGDLEINGMTFNEFFMNKNSILYKDDSGMMRISEPHDDAFIKNIFIPGKSVESIYSKEKSNSFDDLYRQVFQQTSSFECSFSVRSELYIKKENVTVSDYIAEIMSLDSAFIQKTEEQHANLEQDFKISQELYYGFKNTDVIELIQRQLDLRNTFELAQSMFKVNNEVDKILSQYL